MIEIKNVSHAYGELEVLKDVSLNIPDQKITALIGSNGAGKSTLLGVIARLLSHKSGKIYIDQDDMSTLKQQDIAKRLDRKSTRLNSSHVRISYAVFCL